jgi:hypothetical protein
MNKQEWSELTPEAQLKWWNKNAPDETAQFKTTWCFRKYVGDKEYSFHEHLDKWVESGIHFTLDHWRSGPGLVCEKPNSKPSVPNQESNLMIKAVKQFGGVWPDEEETHLYKFHYGRFVTGMVGGTADVVCTREQFESFVESLFDGAPEGTTHCSPEDEEDWKAWWKKDGDEMHCICDEGGVYTWIDGHFDEDVQLIPRPTKKLYIGDTPEQLKNGVTPQAPYIPKVGEECEANLIGHPVFLCLPHCFSNGKVWFTEIREGKGDRDFVYDVSKMEFRPTITERQQRAIDLYPEQPYMPKVGEECEYMIDEGLWFPCFYIGFNSNGKCVIEKRTGCFEVLIANKFRSIKTEREKFIDDHKADVYLYAINTSELISMKQSTGEDLAARVLGYMHDAGFKSP